jgi:hypothetical protein
MQIYAMCMIHLKIESNSSKNRTFAPERLQVAIINNNNNQTTTTTTTTTKQQQQHLPQSDMGGTTFGVPHPPLGTPSPVRWWYESA